MSKEVEIVIYLLGMALLAGAYFLFKRHVPAGSLKGAKLRDKIMVGLGVLIFSAGFIVLPMSLPGSRLYLGTNASYAFGIITVGALLISIGYALALRKR